MESSLYQSSIVGILCVALILCASGPAICLEQGEPEQYGQLPELGGCIGDCVPDCDHQCIIRGFKRGACLGYAVCCCEKK
ncbi:hypothetical protein AAZX31_18G155600 [Glycine max]|uniref:Knottin scorpion toxin-like domain-containing protein n=2 Tax=Glycine subgen. Soja TaxID=1462606 RepID=A0A0R0FAA9_SOYBN|nr:hypothetical protein JHK86_050575 [Glycine max]KAG4924857.1 hypothetical protein JHK87_050397 [Glycine soja]KAG4936497.1 hypothetical protein JHK85_051416 [Glycine max]KAG5091930.1 hypothetical protein JHK82_050708 [Glycine max]KAG5095023.1 hypothetical protein JHK84_050611 [Glycine max]